MFSANEPCVGWNIYAAFGYQLAYLLAIGHRRKYPRIWPAMTTATSPAIIGRQMRIVLADGAMPHQYHQLREAISQTGTAQKTGDPVRLFLVGKAQLGL